jgi:hypothetical protein
MLSTTSATAHSSKVQSSSTLRRRERRSWILTCRLSLSTALSSWFHFNSHSNTHLKSITVACYMKALESWRQRPVHPNWFFSGSFTGLFVKSPFNSCLLAAPGHLVVANQCQCTASIKQNVPYFTESIYTDKKTVRFGFSQLKTFRTALPVTVLPLEGWADELTTLLLPAQIISFKTTTRPDLAPKHPPV